MPLRSPNGDTHGAQPCDRRDTRDTRNTPPRGVNIFFETLTLATRDGTTSSFHARVVKNEIHTEILRGVLVPTGLIAGARRIGGLE